MGRHRGHDRAALAAKFLAYIENGEIPIVAEFAHQHGVSKSVLYGWPEFADLLKLSTTKKEGISGWGLYSPSGARIGRERRRRYRAGKTRIDFYATEQSVAAINSLLTPYTRASTVINRVIAEWWAGHRGCARHGPDAGASPGACGPGGRALQAADPRPCGRASRGEPRTAPPPLAGPPAGSHSAWGEAAPAAATCCKGSYPAHWEPGQLLNVRHFSDGSRIARLLHEDPEREETQTLGFDNAYAAQEFVAWWYAPASARDGRYLPSAGSPPRGLRK